MAVLLGALVALGLGTSDFLGGFVSRRAPSTAALLVAQSGSMLMACVYLAIDHDPAPTGRIVAWSLGSGLAAALGIGSLYRALGGGRMSVVAPIAAVGSGLVPMAWGIAHGERPSVGALSGVAISLLAVVLIARAVDEADRATLHRRDELALSILAGICFGISVTCYSEASNGGSFWPVWIARVSGLVVVAVALTVARQPKRLTRRDAPWMLFGGCIEATCTVLFILAFRRGLTSVVAPVAALYPAGTVLLARVVLREPIGRVRAFGLALALGGLVLLAL